MSKVDVLITGGRVIDPYNHVDEIRDVAVKDGLIVEAANAEANQVIDASGCIVTPGLIDFHCHLGREITNLGIGAGAEAMYFPTGVTTAVDAGTSGVSNYEAFRAFTMASHVRIKAFLNVCPTGLATTAYHENLNPKYFQKTRLLHFLKKYRDQLLGLKIRQSTELVDGLGLEPMKAMLDIAKEAWCPVVVHTTNPPAKVEELARLLRPGDVYAHVYQGKGENVVRDGNVVPEMFEHQKRGVIFDAANGVNHFSFKIARQCLKEGFLPDIISTDLSVKSAYSPGKVFSLPFVLSKYIALGLSLQDIFQRSIVNPARVIGEERELGSLSAGTCADIAIHQLLPKEIVFQDTFGESAQGHTLLKTQATLREGQVVFRQIDF